VDEMEFTNDDIRLAAPLSMNPTQEGLSPTKPQDGLIICDPPTSVRGCQRCIRRFASQFAGWHDNCACILRHPEATRVLRATGLAVVMMRDYAAVEHIAAEDPMVRFEVLGELHDYIPCGHVM
jgi:hypothetical protein